MITMASFYYKDMEFEVPESVYYPREDSMLAANILESEDLRDKLVLEIGCGTGFLSVLMAKKGAVVTATDVNQEAVEISRANAHTNNVELKPFLSDLFNEVEGKFDVIVFNPPYLPVEEGESDETYAGGTTGRETIERFIEYLPMYLSEKGTVFLVISSLTGEEEVKSLFEAQNMTADVIVKEKVPWEELILLKAQRQ